MVGLEQASRLVHAVEERFDTIRSGGSPADRELLDIVLNIIDCIRNNLETRTDCEDAERLLRFFESEPVRKTLTLKNLPFPLTPDGRETLRSAGPDTFLFRIEKAVTTDLDRQTYETLPVLDTIRGIGTVIAIHPPWEQLNRSRHEDLLHILFSTKKNEDELFFTIFDPLIPVHREASVPQEEVRPPGAKTAGQTLKALIVEDDFITRHLEADMLRPYADCDVAVSGNEALEAIKRAFNGDDLYDLIILDILLPDINGNSVLSGLRDEERKRGIGGLDRARVIIVSNVDDIETVRETFREQADAYLVKPVDREVLQSTLLRLGSISRSLSEDDS